MKKAVGIVLIISFLLLDFAALDDITTGNEPDFYGEYATLAVSMVVFFAAFKLLQINKTSKTG